MNREIRIIRGVLLLEIRCNKLNFLILAVLHG